MSWKERRAERRAAKAADKKPRKPFKDTKFAGFLRKVGDKIPTIAGDILDIATSGNPVASTIGLIKDKLEILSNEGDKDASHFLQEIEAKKAEWENEFKMYNLEVDDRKSARDMYADKNHMADYLARQIINWNLPVIFLLISIEIACIFFLRENPEILALISSVIGAAIQALINERLTVVNFFYGSSRGSKDKQALIEKNNRDTNNQ